MLLRVLVVLAMMWPVAAPAGAADASARLPLHRLPLDGALSQNTVVDMLQDRSGLMWFATLGGLNVYDGYTFRTISNDPRNPHTLRGVHVQRLFEDRRGRIWVAGFLGWLDRLDPDSGAIVHLPAGLYVEDGRALSGTTAFHEDAAGMLWIGTPLGVHRYDPARDALEMQVVAIDGAALRGVTDLAPAADGRLWIGTGSGLYRYDPASGAVEAFVHADDDPRSLSHDIVNCVHVDPDGTLWVGTQSGLNRWDGGQRGFTRFLHRDDDPDSLGGDNVLDLMRDRTGRLWIASQNGGGLSLLRDDGFVVWRNDPNDRSSLSVDDVWSLYEDRSGLIWIGTAGGGINQLNPSTHRFNALHSIPYNANSLRSGFVWDLQEDAEGRIWMATLAGIERWDRRDGTFALYVPQPGNTAANQMQALHVDRAGRWWAGSVDGHLYRFDPASGAFTAIAHPQRTDDRFAMNRIWYIGEGPDGRIWVSTNTELAALDADTATLVERIPASAQLPFGGAPIRTSLVDADGVLWFGGGGAGLLRYAPGQGFTARLGHDPADPESLSDNGVRSIHQTPDGSLWIGTQNGLNHLSDADRRAARNHFTLYTEAEGLANNTVYGVVPDRQGRLWLSTNRGLSRLDPATGEVRNYDTRDGLAGDEMNGGAELVARDGALMFGGVTGVAWFDPSTLAHNAYVPPVRITGLEVGGERRRPGMLALHDAIELDHDDSDIALSFAAMDFHQPQKNRFRYRLVGHSDLWTETARNTVSLARLPAGNYRFEVLGSNNDGVWGRQPARLELHVQPPLWASPLAYAAYALALLLAVALYHVAQRRKLAREREYREQLQRAHSLAEANHQLALRYAQYDSLTQLPNRATLLEALGRYMRLARLEDRDVALLLINLDRFQRINDTIGHSLGDHVLKTTAERLQEALTDDEVLARVGSDEFALITLVPLRGDPLQWLQDVAARTVAAIGTPHPHHEPPLTMTASIGAAIRQPGTDSATELLGCANIALHAAKRGGGKRLLRYEPGMIESARQRLSIEGRLRRALEQREFSASYQPLIDLRRRRLAGFEALIRWQPQGEGMIMPDVFIPVAEESGLIVELGDYMIDEVCRQIAHWRCWDLKVAVNVSLRQLRSGGLVDTIRTALAAHAVPAQCLKIEITESAMVENVEDTAEQLRRIRALGVPLSVDDFGTGFSSLGHLKMLPVNELKIDRSFVGDVATSEHSRKIVNSIVRLAHELDLQVVAEGVEDAAAVAYLRSVDCDLAQGYLYDRPRPPQQLVDDGWFDPERVFQ